MLLTQSRCTLVRPLSAEFLASSNGFAGTIPTAIGLLTKLEDLNLYLEFNNLASTIPSEIGQLSENPLLRRIYLNNNNLSGTLPTELGLLQEFRTLTLEKNSFVGSMPVEVCAYVNQSYPFLQADCIEIECPCCLYCCSG
jgi:Leucine-rich repeat (LRR) protein